RGHAGRIAPVRRRAPGPPHRRPLQPPPPRRSHRHLPRPRLHLTRSYLVGAAVLGPLEIPVLLFQGAAANIPQTKCGYTRRNTGRPAPFQSRTKPPIRADSGIGCIRAPPRACTHMATPNSAIPPMHRQTCVTHGAHRLSRAVSTPAMNSVSKMNAANITSRQGTNRKINGPGNTGPLDRRPMLCFQSLSRKRSEKYAWAPNDRIMQTASTVRAANIDVITAVTSVPPRPRFG